jgi:hypothetical protein
MGLLSAMEGSTALIAAGSVGPWSSVGVAAFVTAAALLGGLERLVRVRLGARGHRGGPYRRGRSRFDVEIRWESRSGTAWALLSVLFVGLPLSLARWTPAWIAVLLALLAPPAAFGLARACARWRESPLSPSQLALGWVGWAAVIALLGALERRAALGAMLVGVLVGDAAVVRHDGLRDVLLVGLVGVCSLGVVLGASADQGNVPSRPS